MKHSKIMLTAFRGTSSEKLITHFDNSYHKLILENDKAESVDQLIKSLNSSYFDHVISFGQKPVIRDKLYIELKGKIDGASYKTKFDTDRLMNDLNRFGFSVHISNNAGTSFCNNIYAHGLKYIEENSFNTKMVFIHVPFEKNISDFDIFSDKLVNAADEFLKFTK